MFGILLYDILFFAIPAVLLAFLGVSICLYTSAKRKALPPEVIKHRKVLLIISAVLSGVLVAVVVGFMVLLYIAVAFM